MATKGEKHSPLEQFEIVPYTHTEIAGYDISFTNSSVLLPYISISSITIILLLSITKQVADIGSILKSIPI